MLSVFLVFVVLLALIIVTLAFQFVRNYRVVGANQVAVVSGKGRNRYRTYRGGRTVVWPLINKRFDLDLRPYTMQVPVEAAVAKGIVPLNVKATVSFAVSSADIVLDNAIQRILELSQDAADLTNVTRSVIEGHLRDSIAAMTPEQVMRDKDQLVANMIRVCKEDLEEIGLEITTMNIADVEDSRLDGMDEEDLYIGLLNRTQSAQASAQARQSEAEAQAAAAEESEQRRGEIQTRKRNNERQSLETRQAADVAEQEQVGEVGRQEAIRGGDADNAGVRAAVEAEQNRISYLQARYAAEIVTPAEGDRDEMVLKAKAEAELYRGEREGEIKQLRHTAEIIQSGGDVARRGYLIDNFSALLQPLAQTLQLFPAERISILGGFGGKTHEQLSAVDPHPAEVIKANAIRAAAGDSTAEAAPNQSEDERRKRGAATTGA